MKQYRPRHRVVNKRMYWAGGSVEKSLLCTYEDRNSDPRHTHVDGCKWSIRKPKALDVETGSPKQEG